MVLYHCLGKICMDLPLFAKYLVIYYFFFLNSILWKSSFPWYSSSWNSSYIKKSQNFFLILEFHEFEYHKKLDFHKIKFKKSNRLLNILQTVVNCKIFLKIVVFGHFGPYIQVTKYIASIIWSYFSLATNTSSIAH